MPIIPTIGRRHWRIRILLGGMYAILTLIGITMVTPFLMTLVSSMSNEFDYQRFSPAPSFLWSRSDRFCRSLAQVFNRYPKCFEQMACALPAKPARWTTWQDAGSDHAGIATLAGAGPAAALRRDAVGRRNAAADYSRFVDQYPVDDLLAPVSDVFAGFFLEEHYRAQCQREPGAEARRSGLEQQALDLASARWGRPIPNFFSVGFNDAESLEPYWQQSWFPPQNPKYRDYLLIKEMYRHHYFTPGIAAKWAAYLQAHGLGGPGAGLEELASDSTSVVARAWSDFKAEVAPAAPAVPFAMRAVWCAFLKGPEARRILNLPENVTFDVADYNRIAGTAYATLAQTPFPVPAEASAPLRTLWTCFVETKFPARLTNIDVTPANTAKYREFLRERFKTVAIANRMLETHAEGWEAFDLSVAPPPVEGQGGQRSVWVDFVKTLPVDQRRLRCAEMDYQAFLLGKYGSLAAVNAAHGLMLARIEEAFPPFADAYAVTFEHNEWSLTLRPLADNYRVILTYLLKQSRAITVTVLLILATIFLTLTVNPMCAYALSRFGLRGKDRIILYLLATMAFPAVISTIPAYLLMRDLGLLNTFFALLLPGAANGMAIFMLKGFFDSLPPELYEAATIDGAKEYQIFLIVTLPLMKPILAINALGAFMAAYSGWEWALIICQKKEMWTIAVWMYQASQTFGTAPWIVAAGFVVISIPTLLVFMFCQGIILRGIILPQMK
jgi:ABC-type glycerol-3-phosphate transport system permease component